MRSESFCIYPFPLWAVQSSVILETGCKVCERRILFWGHFAHTCSQVWSQRHAGLPNCSSERNGKLLLPVSSKTRCVRNHSGERAATKRYNVFVKTYCVCTACVLWFSSYATASVWQHDLQLGTEFGKDKVFSFLHLAAGGTNKSEVTATYQSRWTRDGTHAL